MNGFGWLTLIAVAPLAACGPAPDAPWKGDPRPDTLQGSGYIASPSLSAGTVLSDGRMTLTGMGRHGALIRVRTPEAVLQTTRVGPDGRWTLILPPSASAQLFGLSMEVDGGVHQATGYLFAAPGGVFGQLVAGGGSQIVAAAGARTQFTAVDFDHEGGAVVSGLTRPGTALSVRVDRRPAGDGMADRTGRFSLALSQPLRAGLHAIDIASEAGPAAALVSAVPAEPLMGASFRVRQIATGWRFDWITPGGGVQTTLILTSASAVQR